MIIVSSKDTNIEAIAKLLMELDDIHNVADPKRFARFTFEQRILDVQKILEQNLIFTAYVDSKIAGFASIIKKGDHARVIEHLYVKPEFRFQKVATTIIEAIFTAFSNQEIYTSVFSFNSDAIKFYNKLFDLSSLVFKKRDISQTLK